MALLISEKIRLIAKRQHRPLAYVAHETNQSPQNLSNKLTRNRFTFEELESIATALNCKIRVEFICEDGTVI